MKVAFFLSCIIGVFCWGMVIFSAAKNNRQGEYLVLHYQIGFAIALIWVFICSISDHKHDEVEVFLLVVSAAYVIGFSCNLVVWGFSFIKACFNSDFSIFNNLKNLKPIQNYAYGSPVTNNFYNRNQQNFVQHRPVNNPPQPQPIQSTNSFFPVAGHDEYFHGTSRQAALEIKKSKIWVIGKSKPSSVWMSKDFKYASSYAKPNGYVLRIKISSNTNITKRNDKISIFLIPNANSGDCVHLPNLKFVSIYDYQGRIIQ